MCISSPEIGNVMCFNSYFIEQNPIKRELGIQTGNLFISIVAGCDSDLFDASSLLYVAKIIICTGFEAINLMSDDI